MRTAALLLALVVGCHGELRELGDAGAPGDAAPSMAADLAAPHGSPTFASAIQPDLDRLGCAAQPACHGGRSAPMVLIPGARDAAAVHANYEQVKPRASSDAMSLLLRKCLGGSGTSHLGGQPFASAQDATYLRWLDWIRAGAPEGVDGGAP